jgi:peptide/nickel transport system substrate-binding protein
MFTEKRKAMWQILSIGALFCLMGFLFVMPCSAQKAPKGEANIVTDESFMMTGGDCHTGGSSGFLTIVYALHEGLIRRNTDGNVVPALAKSWEMAKNGMSIKFTLNERAKFHNGEPVTANDVKFSYERGMRPELKYVRGGELKRYIDRIQVTDDHHLTFYFKAPFPGFFEWLGNMHGIVPKAYVEKVGDAEFAKHPIGAGPFKWVDFQQDVFVNLEAVPDHYRKAPPVKKLHMKFRVDPATAVTMLKAGEADVVRLPIPNLPEIQNDPKLGVAWAKYCHGMCLVFCDLVAPNEPSPFHDIRVRQAASYAINRKAICEKLLYGSSEPWGDIVGPKALGFDPNVKPDPYDPEKAKALLKEAGYPNGFETTFTLGFLGDKVEGQAIAADLAKVGIRCKMAELEFGTWISNFREKKFRGLIRYAAFQLWIGQKQPSAALETQLSFEGPWTFHTTPEIDAAMKKLSAQYEEKAIAAQTREVSRIYRQSGIRSMLWALHQPFGLSQKVKSYKPTPGWFQPTALEYLELKD